MSLRSLAPRMRQIPARKSAILSVLDIGASKIVCLIARLTPMEPSEALRGRTHRCKVLGIGHQRSNGVKGGAVVMQSVGSEGVRRLLERYQPMLGLQNVYNEEELGEFYERWEKGVGPGFTVVGEPKFDGLAIELV